MVASTAFSAPPGWSVCPGIRWSISRGIGGQFAPESGGQYQRILQLESNNSFLMEEKKRQRRRDKIAKLFEEKMREHPGLFNNQSNSPNK